MDPNLDLKLKVAAEIKELEARASRRVDCWVAVSLWVLGWIGLIVICCAFSWKVTIGAVSILMIGMAHLLFRKVLKK